MSVLQKGHYQVPWFLLHWNDTEFSCLVTLRQFNPRNSQNKQWKPIHPSVGNQLYYEIQKKAKINWTVMFHNCNKLLPANSHFPTPKINLKNAHLTPIVIFFAIFFFCIYCFKISWEKQKFIWDLGSFSTLGAVSWLAVLGCYLSHTFSSQLGYLKHKLTAQAIQPKTEIKLNLL